MMLTLCNVVIYLDGNYIHTDVMKPQIMSNNVERIGVASPCKEPKWDGWMKRAETDWGHQTH